ncbi:MAG: rod shape-determining protein MreC [Deltaproteobacteria bacterium]|nr:rod shape-determining protein MreC [bacterium]MCB9477632.1 rod shape-determining protein MreC [Deltaproteobacteria bacterium]MCB9478580.1 rod shape-determining protein MreC [Deltaproteobacteria bacterium]MCB9488336.1 rod shape-determining protein MreC [Deltaproteobacteria bacterium]
MRDSIFRYKLLVVAVVLVILGLHFASSALDKGDETGWLGRTVISVYTPVHNVVTWPFIKVAALANRYVYLIDQSNEVEILREQNRSLMVQMHQYSELEAENKRLRDLLKFRPNRKVEPLYAKVIARSLSPEVRTILIDKGRSDGIERNMVVLTNAGLIGHVSTVTSNAAKVLLISDANSAVDAVVQRSRASGILKGRSRRTCKLEFINRSDDVEVGDIVVSSGIGGLFPGGYVLGRVVKVESTPTDMFQNVEVLPTVAFDKLEEVALVPGMEEASDAAFDGKAG